MPYKSLIFFRHGQTTYNQKGMFTGHFDAKLTRKGREDAQIVAERLKNMKFDLAIHSKLSRSIDTLNIVLKSHPECKKVEKDDRIIERDYGKLIGKTHWEVVKKYGPEQYDLWHRSFTTRPPKGEHFADVEKRVKPFLKDIIKKIKKEKINVMVSAHGNSIRMVRKIMEGAGRMESSHWFIPYDNYFEYKVKV